MTRRVTSSYEVMGLSEKAPLQTRLILSSPPSSLLVVATLAGWSESPEVIALRKHIPGCVCQPCMHTLGMNRQSLVPHIPWGVHWLADVLSPRDPSLWESLLKNKQTLSYPKKNQKLFKCNSSHGNECLLKINKELVPPHTWFFTFIFQRAGGRNHLLLLKFTLSLHHAVGRPGELLLFVIFSLSPSQVAARTAQTQEKSAQELALQRGLE